MSTKGSSFQESAGTFSAKRKCKSTLPYCVPHCRGTRKKHWFATCCGSWKITRKSLDMSIEKVNLSRKRLKNTSLSNTECAVILGGLLGDGSLKIYPGYINARYSFRHSSKHSAYFYSKVQLLQSIATNGSVQPQKADGWSPRGKLRFCSAALPELTKIHSVTHKKNKLLVRRKWLNHLTAHSLAIWWFDDGSLIGGGRRGVICTDGFTEKECQVLAKYLLVVWGISVRVGPIKGKRSPLTPEKTPDRAYYRLWFSTSQLKLFLQIVLPYLPCAEMIYKCAVRYVDLHLQQRWISLMEQHSPPELRQKCQEHMAQFLGEKKVASIR